MKCPLLKMKPCKKDECAWYVQIRGQDPNTGDAIDKGACAMAWNPTLLIENNKMVGELGAATESLRNRVDETNGLINVTVKGIKDLIKTFGDAINISKRISP